MQRLTLLLCSLCIALLTAQCTNTSAQKKPNPYYNRTATGPVKL